MDSPADADADVKLQKVAADLLADLDRALTASLRRDDGHGGTRVRSFVRARELSRSITEVLDRFQELPQLLDPYFARWIPLLADSFLEHDRTRRRGRKGSTRDGLLVPMDRAVCRILYAFCKVRGEKVIVCFLHGETRCLEVLLLAVERAEENTREDGAEGEGWEWEQRYVVLLWLSHLLLAPFDLASMSADLDETALPDLVGFTWPARLPAIAIRIVPLAVKYLSAPGRERDAAKALLVRIATRRDMQALGLLESLVRWALTCLEPPADAPLQSTHFYLGVLSFLAGFLGSSVETSDMDIYLQPIFRALHAITTEDNALSRLLQPLSLVRKMVLKAMRSIVLSLLRKSPRDLTTMELTESTIGYLLETVSDNDTPVRLAASKALSIITLRLDPDMASQVVEAVLAALNQNVLWLKPPGASADRLARDLSAVDPLEWHGLMLTLSHLLYRRSPPARQLSDIMQALLLGLSFEQRSSSGSSVGANVRDAACFGIWATARRYTTDELSAVPVKSVIAAETHPVGSSILQVLGTELVTTACLDPAGNIRRGASAALQELIGRHPDAIVHGIEVVQSVDYHAVASRLKAIEAVATQATKLSRRYWEALIDGLLSWRGIGDVHAPSRRAAGSAFGGMVAVLPFTGSEDGSSRFETSIRRIMDRLRSLAKRQVEERHGLLLCFASTIEQLSQAAGHDDSAIRDARSSLRNPALMCEIVADVAEILEDCRSVAYHKPELIAEAASRLVVSSLPVLQRAANPAVSSAALCAGALLSAAEIGGALDAEIVRTLAPMRVQSHDVERFNKCLHAVLPAWLARKEPEVVDAAAAAGLVSLIFSDDQARGETMESWASVVRAQSGCAASTDHGFFHALALAHPFAINLPTRAGERDICCEALLHRWGSAGADVETRVVILQSPIRSQLLLEQPLAFLSLLRQGLADFTANARGDVGSHVRLQALKATRMLWNGRLGARQDGAKQDWMGLSVKELLCGVLRLAAEKLDRVRPEAQAAVALLLHDSGARQMRSLGHTSTQYFSLLLETVRGGTLSQWPSQIPPEQCMTALMAGYVTSADTGNDDLVMASRTALTDFCEASPDRLRLVCTALLQMLGERRGEDRVLIPTLEIIAFLFSCGLLPRCADLNYGALCQRTQQVARQSGNLRKILACAKVYGGVASLGAADAVAAREAGRRLGALLHHRWPRVRSAAVDELWCLLSGGGSGEDGNDDDAGRCLMSVDWATADRGTIQEIVQQLCLDG